MVEEAEGLAPPEQRAVAYRAFCLGVVVAREEFEAYLHEPEGPARAARIAEMFEDLQAWLDVEGVRPHLSRKEAALIPRPLGSWERRERIDASWCIESLGVILWALSFTPELPPYDTQVDSVEVLETLGLYRFEPVARFLGQARLRAERELWDAREAAEVWNWRGYATRMAAERVPIPSGRTWNENIASTARTAYRQGWAPAPIRGDFPVFGKPYAELSEDERHIAHSIARERHRALNWLCGYSADWDDVPTDT